MQTGLYEQLLTLSLQEELEQLADPRLYALGPVDLEDSHTAIAQFLEHVLAKGLATFRGAEAAEQQKRLADQVVAALIEALGHDRIQQLSISTPLRRLLAIHGTPREVPTDRPDTPLSRCVLFTGTRLDPSLGSQLRKEITTADRVDILCSFIRWSGLRVLLDELRQLTDREGDNGPRLRVITTSYMGATDPRQSRNWGSFPTRRSASAMTRSGQGCMQKRTYSTARLGLEVPMSARLIFHMQRLSEGLEWTTKISHYELPYLWSKIAGTFETYWQDQEFQSYSGDAPEPSPSDQQGALRRCRNRINCHL